MMFNVYLTRMKFLEQWCKQNQMEVFVKVGEYRHVIRYAPKRLRFEFNSDVVVDLYGDADSNYFLLKICDWILYHTRTLVVPGTFFLDSFGSIQRIRKATKGMLYGCCDGCNENNLEHYFNYEDATLCPPCAEEVKNHLLQAQAI